MVLAFSVGHAAPADSTKDAILLLTADGEGHLGPCSHCPIGVGLGGMSRRASLISSQRNLGGAVLLVDAGNSIFGGDSDASGGKVIVAAYQALGYDAINISYRDFREGKSALLSAMLDSKAPALSANLLDADANTPLFIPFIVKNAGGRRVSLIGITEAPAGLTVLPQLKQQLSGVRIRAPVEALSEWVPKAKAQSDEIVLIYYGTAAGLWPVRQKFGAELSAICAGGLSDRASVPQTDVPLLRASEHGKAVGKLLLGNRQSAGEQLVVGPDIAPDPQMDALLDRFAQAPAVAAVAASSQPTAPALRTAAANADPPPAAQVPAPGSASAVPPTMGPDKNTVSMKSVPGVASAPRVAAHQPLGPKGLAGVNLTAEQVNAAIDRGREFLWAHVRQLQAKRGKDSLIVDSGPDLLAMLALVNAGAAEKIPEFDAQLRRYLDQTDPRQKQLPVYEAGIYCMLIEAYGDPTYRPKLRDAARYLVEIQGPGGSWNYGSGFADPALFGPKQQARPQSLQVFGGTPLDGGKPATELISRVTPFAKNSDGDNSTSQFALLGIRSAARWYFVASQDVWRGNLMMTRSRECADGGWDYNQNGAYGYGSMTCAGICALAIDRYQLGEKDPTIDEQIERGLGWLDQHFSVSANPGRGDGYLYYYLYSLERVGRVLDTEFVGSHEWYPLGARFLVDRQKPGGKWVESSEDEDPRLATSFALLFLTRATSTLDNAIARNGSGELRTALATAPPSRLYIILDASGSMLDVMDGRMKFDIARDAASAMLALLPSRGQAALRVYGHRLRSLEPGSDEDTELKIPMGAYEPENFATALKALRPRGKTPLALSLTQAIQDIGNSDQPTTLVLLTDGGEDTFPRKDPVKVAAALAKLPGITFHIIGFDINQVDWNAQLRAMAQASGGKYWPAPRSGDLQRALRAALLGDPDSFKVVDSGGKEVFHGHFGQGTRLEEGSYQLVTDYVGREFSQKFWINTKGMTVVTFDAAGASRDPSAGVPAPTVAAPTVPPPPSQLAARFCTHCGKPLPAGAKFCPSCGTKVPTDLR
jgi:Mg-chelatase subunit ChlD